MRFHGRAVLPLSQRYQLRRPQNPVDLWKVKSFPQSGRPSLGHGYSPRIRPTSMSDLSLDPSVSPPAATPHPPANHLLGKPLESCLASHTLRPAASGRASDPSSSVSRATRL